MNMQKKPSFSPDLCSFSSFLWYTGENDTLRRATAVGRRSVKENKSVFQLKREELGLTREAASMGMTAVSPERLEKIENDKVQMQPYDAL